MCGRFNLRTSAAELVEFFELISQPQLPLRFNIAPTQSVLVIRQVAAGREPIFMHWGLIPSWSKDPKIGARMINARGETVATKPSFRAAFKRRRCLIPATGFYEWKKTGTKTKQPCHIGMKNEAPFAFAGLWEFWSGADNSAIESCTIITTEPNDLLSEVHDRMPVILHESDYDLWLDTDEAGSADLQSLLVPYPGEQMVFFRISTHVNNPRHEDAACVEPVE